MTDLEISKALALAIGYNETFFFVNKDNALFVAWRSGTYSQFRRFDYRDWNVIGPIAEKYECFPIRTKTDEWFANIFDCNGFYADTPQKAIALAVITGTKK